MSEIFRLLTPITYWILIILWSFILYFYIKRMWGSKTNQLFHVLVLVLAIDAFRTLFESFYFGLWYTSLSGLISIQIGEFLTQPEVVIIPKLINVIAAVIIIVLLLKRWLPMEEEEQNRRLMDLQESEEEFRAFFDNNPLSCWLEDFSEVQKHFERLHKRGVTDLDSYLDEHPDQLEKFAQAIQIKDVNLAALELHKAECKEQLFLGLDKTFTDESFKVFRKEIVDLWQGTTQNSHDGVVKTLDDELRYVQVSFRILPGHEKTMDNVLVTLADNTSKWHAEQQLLESRNRFNLAMQFTNDGLYDWDFENGTIWYSAGWKKMLGYEPDELENDFSVWERLTHPDDVKVSWLMLNEVIDRKRPRFELEFQMQHKDGHWVDILSRANVVFDSEGKAKRVVGTHVDITERKRFEKELTKQKEKIEQYLNLAGVIFVAINSKGVVTLVNQKGCEVLGYAQNEIIGGNWFETFIPKRIKQDVIHTSKRLLNGDLEGAEYLENSILTKTGEERLIAWHNTVLKDANNTITGHLSAGEDITEKRQLENDLFQARKMESIGNLAGGIAHDFNNILSSIIGFTELALADAREGSSQKDDLEEVLAAGLRAKELVQQILAFARQSDQKSQPIHINDIITQTLKLLRPSAPSTIEIVANLEETPAVIGNTSQLHQVVMNLCTNAIHSLQEQGGTIHIDLKKRSFENNPDHASGKNTAKEYIELIITDNGPGIDSTIIEKIFEPYFTTKDIGEGTGMGLAMVKGIIESYGGHIQVKSEPGIMTAFTIQLPSATSIKKREKTSDEPLASGTERILFVDDEPPITLMGYRILKSLGYDVTVKTNSIETLELFKEMPEAFDIVISDVTMPLMTGDELALEIRKIRPDIPIILCTGYSSIINDEKARQIEINALTYKPFTRPDLARTVRAVLDGAQ
ncbi:PAS domain-containing sensor histidine kinase [Desulfopila sp. IMCC35008]|uniref:PAS domain-containing hybrid sensor histidine kinase/response regulator n=1 Tax=Desulfopila sp. IMCC35008 TaxID=2653858 RepID=UPI0013D740AC|nr:PAS domain-containing sensor histidine kinase [Desulfopila sp. IMCC35008]